MGWAIEVQALLTERPRLMPERAMYADFLDTFADLVAERVAAKMSAGVPSTPRKFFSVKEAAAHSGLTEKAFRHTITTDDFPVRAIKRIGRKILIERAMLDQWLDAH